MAEQNRQDWVAPALLIVAALVIGVVVWGVYAATQSDEAEHASLAEQLEAYTACLTDEGAKVPVIETRRDGGFAVIVPGALLDGGIDFERLAAARDSCRHLEPNPLEVLFAGEQFELGGMSGLLPLLESGFGRDRRGPGVDFFGDRDVPFGAIRELCERLVDREIEDFDVPPEVAEICHDLGF